MILQPFGPLIYQETITNEHLEYLKDLAESSREHGQNVGDSLAGNIQEQFKIVGDSEKFNNFMYPHVFSYMESIMDRWEKHSINPGDTTIKELTYHYGRGLWINFQHKNEFNPVHVHTGDLSSVVMIDIPEEQQKNYPVEGKENEFYKSKYDTDNQNVYDLFLQAMAEMNKTAKENNIPELKLKLPKLKRTDG